MVMGGIRGLARLAGIIVAPLLLMGCLLTPGKFVSTMTVNADRTFAFTYKGEVIAMDPSSMMKGLGDKPDSDGAKPSSGDGEADEGPAIVPIAATSGKAAPEQDNETKN